MSTFRNSNFTRHAKRPLDGTEYLQITNTPTTNPTPTGTLTQDVANLASKTPLETNQQTGTTYTLVAGDAGKIVELNNESAITLTVPPASEVDFAIGTMIGIVQAGAGTVTVTAGEGVTLRSLESNVALSGQYAAASLRKTAPNTWHLVGSLA